MRVYPHHYIDRRSGTVQSERLFRDNLVNFIYSGVRENSGFCFNLITSGRASALLSYLNFDFTFNQNGRKVERFIHELNINMSECLLPPESFKTAKEVFQRQIRYWECRPMLSLPSDSTIVVSPSDSKVLVGALSPDKPLFIKEKFFQYRELLEKDEWLKVFDRGDFAIFRLTPDEYHYNHTPVSGEISDFYQISGQYHSCNPGAVVREVTPYSRNDRVVTIINTDVDGGTHVGMVAMVEVTAMMIGIVEQCYSNHLYDLPRLMNPGMYVQKGQPKSLFRPGSSTVILLFEAGRVRFSKDIVSNMARSDASSRFTIGFGTALVETSVRVREEIGRAVEHSSIRKIKQGVQ